MLVPLCPRNVPFYKSWTDVVYFIQAKKARPEADTPTDYFIKANEVKLFLAQWFPLILELCVFT